MSCWVCDSGDTGGSLGTYYFDEDFLTQGQISFNFCTYALDSNTVNITFSSDLYLEGRLYDSNVNGGVLSPGAHSPRRYTATLDTVYGVCGYGEHSFEYATSWYDEYWNSGSSSSSNSFVLKPVRVFLFHNDGDYEADLYQEYTIGGATVAAEDYYIMAVKKDGTAYFTTVNSGGYLFVFDGGTVNEATVNSGGRMAVYSGGTASDCVISGGGSMNLADAAVLKGEVVIGGEVAVAGPLDDASNYSLTFEIEDHDLGTPFLSGYQFLNNDQISSVGISVSDETPEEGEYILIDGFSVSGANNPLTEINFTVKQPDEDHAGEYIGQKPNENYEGQYTFIWNAEKGKYSGVNYNGYNYVLSTENNQLNLSVKKNVQTLYIRLETKIQPNLAGFDLYPADKAKLDQIVNNNPGLNDINICVALDTVNNEQANYYIVGNGASIGCSRLRTMSDVLSDHRAESYSIFVFAHGSGLGFSGSRIESFASEIKASGKEIQNLIWGTSCLNCSFEVAYAMRETTILNIIGSEQTMFGYTFDYGDLLQNFNDGAYHNLCAEDVASIAFATQNLSHFLGNTTKSWLKADSDSLSNLLKKMNQFASQVMTIIPKKDWNKIVMAKEQSEVYENRWNVKFNDSFTLTQVDLYQFMEEVSEEFKDIDAIRNICNEIKDILTKNGGIIHDFSKVPLLTSKLHGISVYMPTIGTFYESFYPKSLLQEEWGKFVKSLHDYTAVR